jgi:hypothetical protein
MALAKLALPSTGLGEMTMSILGALFGKKGQNTGSKGVTFLRQEKRPPMQGVSVLATYRYYKAVSTDAALEFLNKQDVNEQLFYLCVETPEGRWCKDSTGLYDA